MVLKQQFFKDLVDNTNNYFLHYKGKKKFMQMLH